jgi:hypothetical protein
MKKIDEYTEDQLRRTRAAAVVWIVFMFVFVGVCVYVI